MTSTRKDQEGMVNPITLFILIIIISFLIFLADEKVYYALLGMSFLVVFYFSYLECIKRVVVYIIMLLLVKALAYMDLGITTGAIIGLIALILKLYPIFNIGRVLILTSPLKIMSALRYVEAPNTISIALVTALRYLGELNLRMKEIKSGMKVRGLKSSLFHPIRTFELHLIPLVYKCLHVSETLTSSIISRGIEYEGEKTSYKPIYFQLKDVLLIGVTFILLVVVIWKKF